MISVELHDGTRLEFEDGTPDIVIDRVAKSHVRQAKIAKLTEKPIDPTDGMSGLDKFRAGAGKAFYDVGRGVGQIFDVVDRKDIDEANARDKALIDTGAGMAGNIVGNIAAYAPLAIVPGANTVGGGAAIGALSGALQPVGVNDSRAGNAVVGGAFGSVLPALGRVASTAKAAVVDPFTESGLNRIAGGVLRRGASDADAAYANMLQNTGKTPNFAPTVGQSSADSGLASMERAARAIDPQGFGSIADQQRGALAGAVRGIGGDTADDVLARTEAVEAFYDRAKSAKIPETEELKALLNRPAIRQAFKESEVNAANRGISTSVGQTLDMPRSQWANEALTSLPDDAYFNYVAGHKISGGEGNTLLQEIRKMGGVQQKSMFDILGEKSSKSARSQPGLFNHQAHGIDELATQLHAKGFIPDDEMAVDGGVQWLRDAIRSEVNGKKIYSIADAPSFMRGKFEGNSYAPKLGEVPHYSEIAGRPVYSGAALHNAKMALDGARNVNPMGGANKETISAIGNAADDFIKYLDDNVDSYKQAKSTFREMSKPINSKEVGNELGRKFIPATYRDMDNPLSLNYDGLARAVRDSGDVIAKNVTGFKGAKLADTLGAEKMQVLNNVLSDAELIKMGELLGKGGGSDTIQKAAMSHIMSASGVPNWLQSVGSVPGGWIKRAGDLLYGNADDAVRLKLAEALKDPKQAANLMKKAGIEPSKIAKALKLIGQSTQAPMFALPAIMNAE